MRPAAVALVALIVGWYALRSGTYDLASRQETAILVWLGVGAGLAAGVFPRVRAARGTLVSLLALGALALITALSFTSSLSDERTAAELARVIAYGGVLSLAWLALSPASWGGAAAGLMAGVGAVVLVALASRLVPELVQEPGDVERALGTKRLSFPLGYWNAVAAWAAMAATMAVGYSAHLRTILGRAASLALVPAAALVAYLTYSRAGAVGFALGAMAVLVLSRHRVTAAIHLLVAALSSALVVETASNASALTREGTQGRSGVALALVGACAVCAIIAGLTRAGGTDSVRLPRRLARAAGAAAAVGAIALLVAGAGTIGGLWDDFRDTRAPSAERGQASRYTSVSGARSAYWASGLKAFRSNPVGGIGAGAFEFWWSREGRDDEFVRDAHSLYIEQLAELGAPGLVAVLVFLGGLGWLALRARTAAPPRDQAAAVALPSAFVVFLFHAGVDWIWEVTAVAVLGISCAALPAVASFGERRAWRWPWRALGVGVALVAVAVQLPGLGSTLKVRESREAAVAGDDRRALLAADEAASAEPWASTPLIQRAVVNERAGRLAAARLDALGAAKREPWNFRHQLVLARLEARLGRPGQSLQAFRRARRLRPRSPVFREER